METFEDGAGRDGALSLPYVGGGGGGGVSVIAGMGGVSAGGAPGGAHRGFCFVDFASHGAALAAIHALTAPGFKGIPVDHHAGGELKVDWAEPLNIVPEAVMAAVKVLYISNLPPPHLADGTEEGLEALFSRYGRVERVRQNWHTQRTAHPTRVLDAVCVQQRSVTVAQGTQAGPARRAAEGADGRTKHARSNVVRCESGRCRVDGAAHAVFHARRRGG